MDKNRPMNAILLLIPVILIRYPVMRMISKDAFQRAQRADLSDRKSRLAANAYQTTLIPMFISLVFFTIHFDDLLNYIGLAFFIMGAVLYIKSIADYANPAVGGINRNGLYKFSRNPMYVAFFIHFVGIGLLAGSWLFLVLLLLFQISVHYLILAEERWCVEQFGEEYKRYMKEVRRYI